MNVTRQAGKEICREIQDIENRHPDAFIIVNGDFNHCTLNKYGLQYYQHVHCHTLDLCYTIVKADYTAYPVNKLAKSDHNFILLEQRYKPMVQREKPRLVHVQWTTVRLDRLQASLD